MKSVLRCFSGEEEDFAVAPWPLTRVEASGRFCRQAYSARTCTEKQI